MKYQKLSVHPTTYPNDEKVYWAIPAEKVRNCPDDTTPFISMPNAENSDKPKVGILFAQDKHPDRAEKDYSIDPDYVEAVINAGGEPIFITYEQIEDQMAKLDAIILPGGAFNSPAEWYDNPAKHYEDKVGNRSLAYMRAIDCAIKRKMPTLGICAGFQMMAGMMNAKMKDKINTGKSPEHSHKQPSKYILSHDIKAIKDSLLYNLCGGEAYKTNSSHNESLIPSFSMFDGTAGFMVTAYTSKGEIEAIEPKKPWNEFVLAVQYHPECMAKMGDKGALKTFEQLIKAAKKFKTSTEQQEKQFSAADYAKLLTANRRS